MSWLDDLTLSTVIVSTVPGPSLKGLKHAVYDDCIVLKDAVLLGEDSQEVIDGLMVVPREQVMFVQVLGGGA